MELYFLGGRPWRETQLIYHALPRLARPAVVICWPESPYLCLGFSQDLEREVDAEFCARRGLPVFRRAVGGGLVYLDSDQVFFQVVLPKRQGLVPVDAVYRRCLAPVREALGEMGVVAEFRPACDLVVAGRKISGNGGGEIAGHPVVVGNVLLDFDFATMAGAVRAPTELFRAKVREMMELRLTTLTRELGAMPEREAVAECLARAFARAFGPLAPGRVDGALRAEMDAVAEEMAGPDWPGHEPRPVPGRVVKIAEGCYVRHMEGGGLQATWVEVEGALHEAHFSGPAVAGRGEAWERLARALTGVPLTSAALGARVRAWARREGLDVDALEVARLLTGHDGRAETGAGAEAGAV